MLNQMPPLMLTRQLCSKSPDLCIKHSGQSDADSAADPSHPSVPCFFFFFLLSFFFSQGGLLSGAPLCQALHRPRVCRQNHQHQKALSKR